MTVHCLTPGVYPTVLYKTNKIRKKDEGFFSGILIADLTPMTCRLTGICMLGNSVTITQLSPRFLLL